MLRYVTATKMSPKRANHVRDELNARDGGEPWVVERNGWFRWEVCRYLTDGREFILHACRGQR